MRLQMFAFARAPGLETMLDREGRAPWPKRVFVLVRSVMDLAGFEDLDIFSH